MNAGKLGRRLATKEALRMIYVVTTNDGRPCKIGIAKDAWSRFGNLQSANWVELKMHECWYMAGHKITIRIERAVIERMGGHHLRGEWFDIDAVSMEAAILDEAKSINAWVMTPAEFNKRVGAGLSGT